jgi:hypothetical protein
MFIQVPFRQQPTRIHDFPGIKGLVKTTTKGKDKRAAKLEPEDDGTTATWTTLRTTSCNCMASSKETPSMLTEDDPVGEASRSRPD